MSVKIVLAHSGPQVLGGDSPPQGSSGQIGLFVSLASVKNIQSLGSGRLIRAMMIVDSLQARVQEGPALL